MFFLILFTHLELKDEALKDVERIERVSGSVGFPTSRKDTILLMVWKSGIHQLSLVVNVPLLSDGFFLHPLGGFLAGFRTNHQQYVLKALSALKLLVSKWIFLNQIFTMSHDGSVGMEFCLFDS